MVTNANVPPVERCSTCVLRTRHVAMDADGVCRLCSGEQRPIRYKGVDQLAKLLERHRETARRNGARYDLLMTVSGGKDSTYALHQVVVEHGMRPLVFYYDNGFADDQSKRNLEKAVGTLGLDLVRNQDSSLQKRYLKHNLASLGKVRRRRLGRILAILCTGCNLGIHEAAHQVAETNKLDLVLAGGNPIEPDLRQFWKPGHFGDRRAWLLALGANELWEVLSTGVFYNLSYWRNILSQTPTCKGLLQGVGSRLRLRRRKEGEPAIAAAAFHSYVPYDEQRILSTLETELEWRRPEGRSTTTRFDCLVHLLLDSLRQKYLDVSEKEVTYSQMVRAGMIPREEALRRVEQEIEEDERFVEPYLREVLRRVDASEKYEDLRKLWVD